MENHRSDGTTGIVKNDALVGVVVERQVGVTEVDMADTVERSGLQIAQIVNESPRHGPLRPEDHVMHERGEPAVVAENLQSADERPAPSRPGVALADSSQVSRRHAPIRAVPVEEQAVAEAHELVVNLESRPRLGPALHASDEGVHIIVVSEDVVDRELWMTRCESLEPGVGLFDMIMSVGNLLVLP